MTQCPEHLVRWLDTLSPFSCLRSTYCPHVGAFACWQVFCTGLRWQAKVRRLPVVNAEGRLQGILCMNDITLRAEEAHGKHVPELSYDDAVSTFKAVCEHRPAQVAAHA